MLISNYLSTECLLISFFSLFLIPIFSFTLVFKKKKKSSKANLNLPPSPPKLPIIGNLHQLGNLPHRSLHNLSKKHGPVMLLQLGSVQTLVVSSAEAAKDVLKTNDTICCNRPPSAGPKRISYNYLDIVFSPYGEYWKEMKALFISELLSVKRVKSFAYAREAAVDKLIHNLSQDSLKSSINLNDKVYGLIDGIIGTLAFGKVYGTEQFKNEEFQTVLNEAMEMLGGFTAEDFFPSIGGFVDVLRGHNARRERRFRDLDTFFEMLLEQHLNSFDESNIVDVLVRLMKDQSASFTVTKNHVKAILLDTFLGGVNTSSVIIVWAMAELIKNPRVMKKVQAEIRSLVGNKAKVEDEDITKLKYLKMVVKETFRLHPAAPLLAPHEAMDNCKIGGFDVLPQTRILVNAWAIGRNPNSWESPEKFYPERFEDSDIDFKGSNFELLTFGAGRRMCPGLAMGTTNVEFGLANLLFCFDWELPQGVKREDISMEEEGTLVCYKKTPLCLVPIRYGSKD